MAYADVQFFKGYGMIRSHIGSTQECGLVLKLERISHISDQSFGLGYPIGLEAISFTPAPYLVHRVALFQIVLSQVALSRYVLTFNEITNDKASTPTQKTDLINVRTSQV